VSVATRRPEVAAPRAPLAPDALRGLRAMLINMPLREDAPPNCAPLGPALLAARLQQYAAAVSVVDLNAYRVPAPGRHAGRCLEFTEAMGLILRTAGKHGEPHLIGLGGMVTTLRWQRQLARDLRRAFPDALLVSGGGLATEFREGLFKWVPELDGIVHSEADDVILSVGLEALVDSRLGRLDGSRHGPQKVYAGDRPHDLDALPLPAWDLLKEDVDGFQVLEMYIKNEIWGLAANNSSATPFKMTRSLNTVSSRGCPYSCKFCFRGAQGERNWGARSSAALTHEIMWLHERFGVDFVGLLDDNAMVVPSRFEELIPTLGAFCRSKGVRWGTHGRLDEAADLRPDGRGGCVGAARRRVDAMAESGCVYVGFGAESASPRTLLAMGKGGHILSNGVEHIGGFDLPKTMLHGYANTIKAGLHGNCTWIMGWPGATLEDEKHSVAFMARPKMLISNPAAVNTKMFVATAYPGTEFFKNPHVQERLTRGFGLSFGPDGQPIVNDALLSYVLELDDADKLLVDKNGEDVYYGAMTPAQFRRCRELVAEGRTEEILSL